MVQRKRSSERRTRPKRKIPFVDLGRCNDCGSCVEFCAQVFRKNQETGLIEVVDLPEYPEDAVEEAISMCPESCISWQGAGGAGF